MTRTWGSVEGTIDLPAVRRLSFEAPTRHDRIVQLYGTLDNTTSFSNVGTQLAWQLVHRIGSVAVLSYSGCSFFDGSLEEHAGLDRGAPIALFHGVPDSVPTFLFDHPTTIGAFVCESDRIPSRWVRRCNRFDLILVPSRYCRQAFVDSGIETPIALAPHGLEPDYRPTGGAQRGDLFTFYDVVNTHRPKRKGCEELIRSFVRAFEGRDDVVLRLRGERTPAIQGYLDSYRAGSLVELDDATGASTAEFAALYSRVHCTVHPARGEGFGLIPLQSIACETPVIAPRATGMADYLNEDNAMLLATLDASDDADVYYGTGHYPRIDEDHLVELLRHAERDWAAEKARVERVAPAFRAEHGWERALSPVMTLIKELADAAASSTAEQRRERIHTYCLDDGWRPPGASPASRPDTSAA